MKQEIILAIIISIGLIGISGCMALSATPELASTDYESCLNYCNTNIPNKDTDKEIACMTICKEVLE